MKSITLGHKLQWRRGLNRLRMGSWIVLSSKFPTEEACDDWCAEFEFLFLNFPQSGAFLVSKFVFLKENFLWQEGIFWEAKIVTLYYDATENLHACTFKLHFFALAAWS